MRTTKKALTLSILSVLLCVAMLVGTTFAWFSDSVTSGANKIVAGNLDIDVEYSKDGSTWLPLEGDSNLFADVSLWEPGATSVVYLRLTNRGTLALKYRLSILSSTSYFTNKYGESKNLMDALRFVQIPGATLTTFATREEAQAAAENAPLWNSDFTQASAMAAGEVSYVTLVMAMPTTVSDEYNYMTGTPAPEISVSITVNATQLMSESDSFDNTYDAGAPWLGGIDEVPAEEDGVITIMTAEQLAGFAKAVNEGTSFAGKTVKLGSNINLNNIYWSGINANNAEEAFTFDGNGKTVKNLAIAHNGASGLFNYATGCTVRNLTVDSAVVTGTNHVGVIVGNGLCTKLENCTVKNAEVFVIPVTNGVVYDDGDKAGAFVGYLSGEPVAYVKNCTVSDTTVTAFRDLGAIVGMANGTAEVSGNTVGENVKLAYRFIAPYNGHINENMGEYAGRIAESATVNNNQGAPELGEANLLTTADDLLMLAAAVNGGYGFDGQTLKLGNDIDFAGGNLPAIGTEGKGPFNGVFDGNGKTVKNAVITSPTQSGVGFIGYIGGGTVKDLTLENVDVIGVEHVGVLVGFTATGASTVTGCTVKNCSATGIMRDETDNSANGIGAIIGHVAQGGGVITLTDNTIDTVTLKGYRRMGTFAGGVQTDKMSAINISGNIADKVTMIQDITLNKNPKHIAAGATVGEYLGELYSGTYLDDVMGANTVTNYTLTVITNESKIKDALAAAQPGDTVIIPNVDAVLGTIEIPATLENVIIKGEEGAKVEQFAFPAGAEIKNVTVENVNFDLDTEAAIISIGTGAAIENVVFTGCEVNANSGSKYRQQLLKFDGSNSGTVTIENSVISNIGRGLYCSGAFGSDTNIRLVNTVIKNSNSWACQCNGNAKSIYIEGCTFENVDGIAKLTGTGCEDFTFINNTILPNEGSDPAVFHFGHDNSSAKAFSITATNSLTVYGNKIGTEDWTPNASYGLQLAN